MMKKVKNLMSILLVAVLLVSTLFSGSAFANNSISVEIDGQRVNFSDQQPVIIDGRTLVPVRGVFEALGFLTKWESDTQTATIGNSIYTITISIGVPFFYTNGTSYPLDVPAQIINGRTMLPIRSVLESVGCDLYWDSGRNTAMISSNGIMEHGSWEAIAYWNNVENTESVPTTTPQPQPTPTSQPTYVTNPNKFQQELNWEKVTHSNQIVGEWQSGSYTSGVWESSVGQKWRFNDDGTFTFNYSNGRTTQGRYSIADGILTRVTAVTEYHNIYIDKERNILSIQQSDMITANWSKSDTNPPPISFTPQTPSPTPVWEVVTDTSQIVGRWSFLDGSIITYDFFDDGTFHYRGLQGTKSQEDSGQYKISNGTLFLTFNQLTPNSVSRSIYINTEKTMLKINDNEYHKYQN